MNELSAGKLSVELLGRLLASHTGPTERLVVPPRVGEDAAVIELPDRYLVVATDPITLVTEDLGHYLVTINANDVATLGARPLFFSCVLLFPEGTRASEVERVFGEVCAACGEQEVVLIGGHTEVTPTVAAPVAVGQMIGEVDRDRLVRKDQIRPGDRLLLTKGLAVEAVSIIARERAAEVRQAQGEPFLRRARAFLRDPGIGVVREALAATAAGGVHAMHDITEGGLSGGLLELAAACHLGLTVRRAAIPIYPETRALCDPLGLDPLGVIASGSLLLAVDPAQVPAVVAAVQALGVACVDIGWLTAESGCRFEEDGAPLPVFAVDEITKLRG